MHGTDFCWIDGPMTHDEVPLLRLGVIGVIPRDARVLMIRRAKRVPKGGTWCFPGGHVEQGESLEEALRRELFEELALDVSPGRHLGSVRVTDGGYLLEVFVAHCSNLQIQPNRAEVADVRWVRPAEIATIQPGLPSNARVLEMLPGDFAHTA